MKKYEYKMMIDQLSTENEYLKDRIDENIQKITQRDIRISKLEQEINELNITIKHIINK